MPAQPAARLAASPATIHGWVVLAIGVLRLALPQHDVRQLEPVSDLKESAAGETDEVGWFLRDGARSWPAYGLDEQLRLERPAAPGRRLCVFIGAEDAVRGIVCNRVWSLAADADLGVEPLPGCMRGPRSPAIGLARFEDGVALVTDATALAAYLDFLKKPAHDGHD
jgi:hypothetical protein